MDNPENKFDGDIGVLMRKQVHVDGVFYIGKEANNIDEQALKVKEAQVFINEEEIKRKILDLTPKEAREMGIKYRSTLKKIKDNIDSGTKFNFKTKVVKMFIELKLRLSEKPCYSIFQLYGINLTWRSIVI